MRYKYFHVIVCKTVIYIEGAESQLRFYSLFAGKMLGDGYMNLTCGLPRFVFLHSSKDREYARHCFNLFSQYIEYGSGCCKESAIYDKRTKKYYRRIYYQSISDPILRDLYPLWYSNRRKKIPMEWVSENLEADGLALWYQDDGCLKSDLYRIILSAESFSDKELYFLKGLLQNKFGIKSQIDSQRRIDISTRREIRKFQALVEPYIHPSMKRKSMAHKWKEWILEWQQIKEEAGVICTSIYLPERIYNKIRGQGYSFKLNKLLNNWLDTQWYEYIIQPTKRYKWILEHENIVKGKFLICPRFKPHIRKKLDILSVATGFEISELVVIAFCEKSELRYHPI